MPDAAGVPDGPPLTWVVQEAITVPVDGETVTSVTVLGAGIGYRLRASGTWIIQSAPGTQADAEYWDFSLIMDGVGGVDVGLAVDDTVVDTIKTPNWGPYSTSHVYEVPWTGGGTTIIAQIHDGNFGNNTGSITLTILAWQ